MKSLIRFKIILISLFLLAIPHSAFAMKPLVEIFTFPEPAAFVEFCGDFLVLSDAMTTQRQTTYFDKDGNIVRVQHHFDFDDNFYNSEIPDGLRIPGHAVINLSFRNDGTIHQTGVVFHVEVPDLGTIYLATGLIVVDEDGNATFMGRWDFFGDVTPLCDYFGNQ